jgi:hypothetical protein
MTYSGPEQAMRRPRTGHARRRPPQTPIWWRDLVGILCWASALVVLTLWVSGHGVQSLATGPADLLTSLGRLSGLVAADLLLVQVFLMARVPVIERSDGQDELTRRHRAHEAAGLVFRDELEQLARRRGVVVHYLLGRRIPGRGSWLPESARNWSDADAMRQLVPEIEQYDVYVCGPDRWMDAVCGGVGQRRNRRPVVPRAVLVVRGVRG